MRTPDLALRMKGIEEKLVDTTMPPEPTAFADGSARFRAGGDDGSDDHDDR